LAIVSPCLIVTAGSALLDAHEPASDHAALLGGAPEEFQILQDSPILGNPGDGDSPCFLTLFVFRRQLEVRCESLEVSLTERRPLFHEGIMGAPELTGGFGCVFREFRRAVGILAA
jgi:hypothetical protein